MRICILPSIVSLLTVAIAVTGVMVAVAAAAQSPPEIATPTKSSKHAYLTLDQIRDGIKSWYNGLWALEVEYVETARRGKLESAFQPKMRIHFAFKGEKRFKASFIGDETDSDLMLAFDGSAKQQYLPKQSRSTLMKQKGNFIDSDAYASNLALTLSDNDRSRVATHPFTMPSALDVSWMKWSVEPQLEIVDGVECHVLHSEPSGQRIWVDPAIGFVMRLREIRQVIEKMIPDQWPLAQRTQFSDFQEISPKTWLPKRAYSANYVARHLPRDQWNKVSYWAYLDVQTLRVGDQVKDAVFHIELPKGTMVSDELRTKLYRVGDANEELDLAVDQGHAALGKNRTVNYAFYLIIINVIILAGYGVFMLCKSLMRFHAKYF